MKRLARIATVTILGPLMALTAACGSGPASTAPSPQGTITAGCGPATQCIDFTHGMGDEHGFLKAILDAKDLGTLPWSNGTPTVFNVTGGGTITVKGDGNGKWFIDFSGVDVSKLTFAATDHNGGTATAVLQGDTLVVTTFDAGHNPRLDDFTETGQRN